MIKKRMLLIIVLAFICFVIMHFCGNYYYGVLKHKSIIHNYVESNYGGNYNVLMSQFGSIGASGRRDDYVVIKHENVIFKVSISETDLITDTYKNSLAETVLNSYIMQLISSISPNLDCMVCSSISTLNGKTLTYVPEHYRDILEDDELEYKIDVHIFSEEISNIQTELLDIYNMLCVNFKGTSLCMRIEKESNKQLYNTYPIKGLSTPYYEYYEASIFPKESLSTYEFINQFRKYE